MKTRIRVVRTQGTNILKNVKFLSGQTERIGLIAMENLVLPTTISHRECFSFDMIVEIFVKDVC